MHKQIHFSDTARKVDVLLILWYYDRECKNMGMHCFFPKGATGHMKVRITSDSTCDFSREMKKRFQVGIIPLYVIKDGIAYRDSKDITCDEIFAHVAAGGALCTTSAVSQSEYEDFFEKQLEGYDGLVHVSLSSEMSSCHQNAVIAAEKFKNVHVVDSRNLSSGQGLIVIRGSELAQKGELTAKEIAEELRAFAPKVDASFIVDDLTYLRKGGRCSALAALGANLLSIKPCIEVHDGKMSVARKYRGAFRKALKAYVADRLKEDDTIDASRIFITHTPVAEGVVDTVKTEVEACKKFDEVIESDAYCVISCHCGPNTLGILYTHK